MYHVSDLMLCCKQGSFGDVGIDTVKWGFEGQQFFFFFGGGGGGVSRISERVYRQHFD